MRSWLTKYSLLWVLIFGIYPELVAQSTLYQDSLLRLLEEGPANEPQRVETLLAYANTFTPNQTAKAEPFFLAATQLAHSPQLKATALLEWAKFLSFHASFSKADSLFEAAYPLAKEAKDISLQVETELNWGLNYLYRARCQESQPLIDAALAKLPQLTDPAQLSHLHQTATYQFLCVGDSAKVGYHNQQFLRHWEQTPILDTSRLVNHYLNMGLRLMKSQQPRYAIDTLLKAEALAIRYQDTTALLSTYYQLSVGYKVSGNYPRSLQYGLENMRICELASDSVYLPRAYNRLGILHYEQKKYARTLPYYRKYRNISIALGTKHTQAIAANNIGLIFLETNQVDSAEYYFNQCLEVSQAIGYTAMLGWAYTGLAEVRLLQKKPEKAQPYIEMALAIRMKVRNRLLAKSLYTLGNIHLAKERPRQALSSYEEARQISEEVKDAFEYRNALNGLSRANERLGNTAQALAYYKEYMRMEDSLNSMESSNAQTQILLQYALDRETDSLALIQTQERLVFESEITKRRTTQRATTLGLILVFLLLLAILRSLQNKRTANKKLAAVNEEVQAQNEEIAAQRDKIDLQKSRIEQSHRQLTSSISYAERIQQALLSNDHYWQDLESEYFIYYQPKDVVSGDFYWAYTKEEEPLVYWAVADCTGHGVPGAFMSVLSIGYLNEIAQQEDVLFPDTMLELLREKIIQSLEHHGSAFQAKDGLDIALCALYKPKRTLYFAGANQSLFIIRDQNQEAPPQANSYLKGEDVVLYELKGNRIPVGYYPGETRSFNAHTIPMKTGDLLYAFTDGYPDQFGGPMGKKFKSSQLRKLLLTIHQLPLAQQKETLNQTFEAWKRGSKLGQIDDVTIVCVKIS
ncbi:MAG: tetratricopeptide repeat protein [Bacteroidota bacterium]